MEKLVIYREFDVIFEDMYQHIYDLHECFLKGEKDIRKSKKDIVEELKRLLADYFTKSSERLGAIPSDHYNNLKRHIHFCEAHDIDDILKNDLPGIKKWTYERIISPKKQVFIAMSFSLENRELVQEAMTNACKEFGYNALTVDMSGNNGGITDKILEMIDDSKFVISDFTEDKRGVYYEAGFARGRNKEVIHTVHEQELNKIHFDIKHVNTIVWSSPDDLFNKLVDRISKTIVN